MIKKLSSMGDDGKLPTHSCPPWCCPQTHTSVHKPKFPRAGQHDCIHVTQEGSCGSHSAEKNAWTNVSLVTLIVYSLYYQGNAFALSFLGETGLWESLWSEQNHFWFGVLSKHLDEKSQARVLYWWAQGHQAEQISWSRAKRLRYMGQGDWGKSIWHAESQTANVSQRRERIKYSWYVKKSENWEFSTEFSNMEVIADLEKSNSGKVLGVKDDHSKLRETRR